jgi:hypothetical protein
MLSCFNGFVSVGFLVMIEFCIFSFIYVFIFSATMTPNPSSKAIHASTSVVSSSGSGLSDDASRMSCVHFLCEVFAFCDMYGTLTPRGGSLRAVTSDV